MGYSCPAYSQKSGAQISRKKMCWNWNLSFTGCNLFLKGYKNQQKENTESLCYKILPLHGILTQIADEKSEI